MQNEYDEKIEDWTQDQLKKRSKELQLVDEAGKCILAKADNRKYDYNRNEDISLSEMEEGSKSASTTSDSQVCITHYYLMQIIIFSLYECYLLKIPR